MSKKNLKDSLRNDRVLKHARLFIKRDATLASVAKETGWSVGTVFLDLTERLYHIHPALYTKVQEKLEDNKDIGPKKVNINNKEKIRRKKE